MKRNLKIFTLIALAFYCHSGFAQSNDIGTNEHLFGKWNAVCGIEYVDRTGIRHCNLCPFLLDTVNKQRARIEDVTLTIDKDSISLNSMGTIEKAAFKHNEITRTLKCKLKGEEYEFRTFVVNESLILEDQHGLVMLLSKLK